MNSEIVLSFNGWGILMLILFAGGHSISHFYWVRCLYKTVRFLKILAFISLVLIFVLSGWKAGLIALPVCFICSWIGSLIAKQYKYIF